MVLSIVIPSLVLLPLGARSYQEVSREEAIGIADRFVQFANQDQYGAGIVESFESPIQSVELKNGRWHVRYSRCFVSVIATNGRIGSYSVDADLHTEYASVSSLSQVITSETALAIMNAVHHRAGFQDTLTLYARENVVPEWTNVSVQTWGRRFVGSTELDVAFCATYTLHATSGQLLSYSVPPDPILPPSLTPRLSLPQARSLVMTALSRFVPNGILSEYERCPLKLRLWYPNFAMTVYEDLPFDADQYLREWRTVLAYNVRFVDEGFMFPPGRGPALWHVVVDAVTGKLLMVGKPDAGFGSLPPRRATFGWDLGPGPLTVTANGKTTELETGDVAKVPPRDVDESGVPVILQRGRLILNALYYPIANLLAVGEGKLRSLGRPDGALSDSLRKTLSP